MGTLRFWDTEYQDTSDLAVIVAGDICEQRINPADYLQFQNDLDYLSTYRLALLAGFSNQSLLNRSLKEIDSLVKDRLCSRFEGLSSRNDLYISCLKLLVLPFGRWSANILAVEYSSLPAEAYTSENIKDILRQQLEFDIYDRYQNGHQILVDPKNIISNYRSNHFR